MVKCVINDVKTGKSYQTEIENNPALGQRLGSKVDGADFGLAGYELEIAGASDNCGFPLRSDIISTVRKKPLFVSGIGLRINKRNDRQRKTVSPNNINDAVSQLNLKVLKYGTKSLDEVLGKKEERSAEEKPAAKEEAPKVEEKKEEQPKEESKAEEKPAEKTDGK